MESNNNFVPNPPVQKPQYDVNEAFEAKLRYLKVCDLQHILRKHSLHTTGNKLSLIGRICDYYKNALNKANAGQLSAESIASMFAEVEALYGNKLNSSARSYHPPAPSVPVPASTPSNGGSNGTSNGAANGESNGVHTPGVSPFIQQCFNENSFCQFQSIAVQTRILNLKESHGGHVFNFDLAKEVGNALYTNNINLLVNQETKYCIQLFSFDVKKLEPGHTWPTQQTAAHFEVRVNHRVFQIKRGGKKDKDRVADITSYCRPGNNSITILWNGSGNYMMYVTVSKRISVETLVDAVITKRTRDYDTSLDYIKKTLSKRAGSDELQEVSTKVSLMCPATKAVMQIPCRATTCNHLQCFELQSYLMMNERVPRWQCPHCSKTALYKDLFVDSFFKKVIEQISKADITEIEFKSDGSWQPVSKKRKVEQVETSKQVFEILDEDDEPPTNSQMYRAPSSQSLSRSNSFTNNNNSNNNYNNTTNTNFLPPSSSSSFAILPTSIPKPPTEVSQYGYDVNKCFICGATQNLKRCSRCRGICYCGIDCQGQDWGRHKEECRETPQVSTSNNINSAKTENENPFSQQKFKIQKREGLNALADSATAVAFQNTGSSGNADDPIELD